MAHTTVRDVVIWTKHVHGGDMAQRLSALPGEAEVTLVVDGVRGQWCKMRDGKDGRSTSGLRPVGRAQAFWQSLFDSRRGESVTIDLAEPADSTWTLEFPPVARDQAMGPSATTLFPALARNEAERRAALDAIMATAGKGWSSNGWRFNRDELYDRDSE